MLFARRFPRINRKNCSCCEYSWWACWGYSLSICCNMQYVNEHEINLNDEEKRDPLIVRNVDFCAAKIRFSERIYSFSAQLREKNNKWRGVTISLRTGGQGHQTPIHTPTHLQHSNIWKTGSDARIKGYCSNDQTSIEKARFTTFQLDHHDGPTDRWTDGPTDRLSRVSATKTTKSMLSTDDHLLTTNLKFACVNVGDINGGSPGIRNQRGKNPAQNLPSGSGNSKAASSSSSSTPSSLSSSSAATATSTPLPGNWASPSPYAQVSQ